MSPPDPFLFAKPVVRPASTSQEYTIFVLKQLGHLHENRTRGEWCLPWVGKYKLPPCQIVPMVPRIYPNVSRTPLEMIECRMAPVLKVGTVL